MTVYESYTVIQGPPPIKESWGHTHSKPLCVEYGLRVGRIMNWRSAQRIFARTRAALIKIPSFGELQPA
eukprot:COSAG05_NODE_1169_length_5605_cov_2.698987_1_plen_69_part_00